MQIEGRTADHLEDFRGGGLLLERLAQLLGPCLHLLEQPDVVDCDHRLVGEGIDQLDLLRRKKTHCAAS